MKTKRTIAIYARYSSDAQNPASVDDQIALCRQFVQEQFHEDPDKALVFSDAEISGEVFMERPGILGLISLAQTGTINLLIAEGLDRISRSMTDTSGIYEILTYYGVMIWTGHEGRITELHVGFKGTMNAVFLKDMKAKVRRGQKQRVLAGYASSRHPYGYRVVRGVVDQKGRSINGILEIDEKAAAVIRRVYKEYVEGRTILEIVEGLNRAEIPAPAGGIWKRNALMGGAKKLEGVLRNETYLGKLVFNKSYVVRDPITRKKRQFPLPEEKWTRVDVPHLRIVSDEMWAAVRALDHPRILPERKQKPPAEKWAAPLRVHNQHALTGWVKCGWCGGPKNLANASRYTCSTNRYAKKCKNARGTNEQAILIETFAALRIRVQDGKAFHAQFAKAFASMTSRQEKLKKRASAIQTRREHLLDIVERGVGVEAVAKRIVLLEEELKRIEWEQRQEALPSLPDEETIRTTLLRTISEIGQGDDIKQMRMLFSCLLKEIVLTPIPGQKRGEAVTITLREEGWPDFWRMITAP